MDAINYNEVGKNKVFGHVLADHFGGQSIKVLEYGRLRNPKERARHTDGWSTLEFATHASVTDVYSLDTNTETKAICKQVIPDEVAHKVHYAQSVDEFDLEKNSIDLLFLDADNDPQQCLELYQEAILYLKPEGKILIDDVTDEKGHKGDVLLPLLTESGFVVEEYHPFVLIRQPGE